MRNLERLLRNFQINNSFSSVKNSNDLDMKILTNLRHALIRVGIKRILDKLGKKIADDDLINNDNALLLAKFIEILR